MEWQTYTVDLQSGEVLIAPNSFLSIKVTADREDLIRHKTIRERFGLDKIRDTNSFLEINIHLCQTLLWKSAG